MFKDKIEADLKKVAKELGYIAPADTVVYIPEDSSFGDYSTNIALQLSKQKHKDSYQKAGDIANKILEKLGHPDYLERIEIAGPGFLNFYLKDDVLISLLTVSEYGKEVQPESSTRYLVEYAHPNTHKEFHIGHLRTLTTGESIARLLSFTGNEVFRVDYGSDIGLPVAKALWAILKKDDEFQKIKENSTLKEKAAYLGKVYVLGNKAYEDNPEAKEEIDKLTKKLYQGDPGLVPLWEETKKWSLGYFESIYIRLGTEFDARINESEISEEGKKTVMENIGKVFVEDQGAIIFPGEKYGLHNRVFINSQGNPTYEAKELGLTFKELSLFPFDYSLHVVDTQQTAFFQVVTKAIELIEQRLKDKKIHIPYGFVSLTTGRMSSRKGNIINAEDLIEEVTRAIMENYPKTTSDLNKQTAEKIAIAATKFFYLKYSLTSDIVFDIQKSISLQGDSGPYVLYVYARINSILNRAKSNEAVKTKAGAQNSKIAQILEPQERELLRQLEYFELITEKAAKNLQPNELTSYLLNLSKSFNSFYESCPILVSDKKVFRLELIKKTAEVIKLGLYLLGIETVERM